MKQYVIDQLRESDFHQIKAFLDHNTESASLDGIYWADLPPSLYTEIQREHAECQPFYFAIHLTWNDVAFELLIRSRQVIRCRCIAYATPAQRDHIIHYAERMIEELKLKL
jgi:hypothetical protein